MEYRIFDTRGLFDGIPDVRQVIHKQYIIMLNRWIFDVELSFDRMKFFIIVKRKLSVKPISETAVTKQFTREYNRDLKKELKDLKFRYNTHSDLDVLKEFYAKPKLFSKQMWVT